MIGSQECKDDVSTSCLKAEKKKAKINYKSGGRHWVMDSGCSQHMTGNSRIFTTLEEGDHDRDHFTLGDNSRKKVIGLGKIAITNDLSIQNVLHVEDLCLFNGYQLENYVILDINACLTLMIFWSLMFMIMS